MPGTPPFRPFEHPDQARFDKTRALFAYWQTLQAEWDRPARTDLDPARMKPFLPNVVTGHIEAAPFRVLFRLVGTTVAEYSRLDFSGRYLDELQTDRRDNVDWHACYRFIHVHRVPIIGDSGVMDTSGAVIHLYEYAVLPLWRDEDPAGAFIGIEVYDDLREYRIADLNRVEVKREA
jgi:hypothetical protein